MPSTAPGTSSRRRRFTRVKRGAVAAERNRTGTRSRAVWRAYFSATSSPCAVVDRHTVVGERVDELHPSTSLFPPSWPPLAACEVKEEVVSSTTVPEAVKINGGRVSSCCESAHPQKGSRGTQDVRVRDACADCRGWKEAQPGVNAAGGKAPAQLRGRRGRAPDEAQHLRVERRLRPVRGVRRGGHRERGNRDEGWRHSSRRASFAAAALSPRTSTSRPEGFTSWSRSCFLRTTRAR